MGWSVKLVELFNINNTEFFTWTENRFDNEINAVKLSIKDLVLIVTLHFCNSATRQPRSPKGSGVLSDKTSHS